jgi:hypothetical protein
MAVRNRRGLEHDRRRDGVTSGRFDGVAAQNAVVPFGVPRPVGPS